jgi:hypothetical protein
MAFRGRDGVAGHPRLGVRNRDEVPDRVQVNVHRDEPLACPGGSRASGEIGVACLGAVAGRLSRSFPAGCVAFRDRRESWTAA